MRRYFPSLLQPPRTESGEGITCLELDYVPFPNLAELFLHWRLGANGWRTIIRRLAGSAGIWQTMQARRMW